MAFGTILQSFTLNLFQVAHYNAQVPGYSSIGCRSHDVGESRCQFEEFVAFGLLTAEESVQFLVFQLELKSHLDFIKTYS